jgi:hypothetical protein
VKKENAEFRMQSAEGGGAGRIQNMGNAEAWLRTPIKEALKIGIKGLKAGRGGKRRPGRRGFTALSGKKVGRFTGFYRIARRCYRLGPDNLMQVVDFPRLRKASIFWREAENRRILVGGMAKRSLELLRRTGVTKGGVRTEQTVRVEKGAFERRRGRVFAKNGCAQLHVFTRFYTKLFG